MTSVIEDGVNKKPSQPLTPRNKLGWVSPAYTQSGELQLDEQVLQRNRCIGMRESGSDIEAYEILRAQILKRSGAEQGATIMITSALPGEGKTLTAVNLAFSMAREFTQTVLLVDCDLKQQQIQQVLGITDGRGLGDYFMENIDFSELVRWPGVEKLTLVTGGRTLQGGSEIFSSRGMRELVQDMKTRYPGRYVFFDAPPVLGGAEALALAELVDHIVVTVKAATTARESIHKALELLPKEKVLGFVYNAAKAPENR